MPLCVSKLSGSCFYCVSGEKSKGERRETFAVVVVVSLSVCMYSNGEFLIVQTILDLFCCVGTFDLLVNIPDVFYVARV